MRADRRKELASERTLSDKEVSSSKKVSAREVESEMADVGFNPWDEPTEVMVSEIDVDLDCDDAVFDTGATHNVFNLVKHFISLKEIEPIKLTLADGSEMLMITGVGLVSICLPFDETKSCVRHRVYLCKDMENNLISGVAMYEGRINFHTALDRL